MSLTPDRANAYLEKRQGNTADLRNSIENQNTPNDNHWNEKFRSRRELYDEYKGLGVADTALTHAEDLLRGMEDFGPAGLLLDKGTGLFTGRTPRTTSDKRA
ncbi:MAG: hypothetical protein DU429_01385 [Candidatus Tokpelaia sp.]|nr:MAG: hypothetical protein DU430_03015 [Candidatus Tokpelaia sp.]KAA6207714.1 MAG: hypothetical protein DU429_01385 [Candidatus Tokpelaia sp.]